MITPIPFPPIVEDIFNKDRSGIKFTGGEGEEEEEEEEEKGGTRIPFYDWVTQSLSTSNKDSGSRSGHGGKKKRAGTMKGIIADCIKLSGAKGSVRFEAFVAPITEILRSYFMYHCVDKLCLYRSEEERTLLWLEHSLRGYSLPIYD